MSRLVRDSVGSTLVRMAIPMLAGTFAINAYQLTNAWFVSRLGTETLAAISFTFPVVMLFAFVTRGLGTGAMTLVAHALGAGDHQKASTLTSHALLLGVVFAIVMSTLGLLTVTPLFSALGASGDVLSQAAAYMRIWYLGSVVMVLQVVASDVVIATGNTKAISALMVGGTVANVFFDMGLIFGRFGLPKMGITGAALATILSQFLALCGAFYMLRRKFRLIDFGTIGRGILASWGAILRFGIPGALGMIMTPLGSAVITRLVAGYGTAAVAAAGVAGRIEMFAFMIPMTVGMSLIPFVAQNYGAGRLDRVRTARRGSMTFAVLYGVFIGAMFVLFADHMARLFSEERAVVDVIKAYIYITCAGYGCLEVHRYAGFCLMGTHRPLQASLLDIIRIGVLLIPLATAGSLLLSLHGIFFGRLATDLAAGLVGIWWSGYVLRRAEAQHAARGAA